MFKFFFFIPFLFFISSCVILDTPKRIAGFSVQKFEKETDGRHLRDFEISETEAFDKTVSIIKKLKARITHKSRKKGYIVAFDFSKSFDFCLDSTEAGFFIEKIDDAKTRVTVICNNSVLAKSISLKYFEMLIAPAEEE